MDKLAEHHDLALRLLVGRSLPDGLPWTVDEDRLHIARERALWAELTEAEQGEEQSYLLTLWRGPDRHVQINPVWGKWAEKGGSVEVTNEAFGLPRQDFRPFPKGYPVDGHPGYARVVEWLWGRGFQVVDISPSGWLVMPISERRILNEANRLRGLLTGAFPHISVQPLGLALGIQIRGVYDPVGNRSFLEMFGLDDYIAFSSPHL